MTGFVVDPGFERDLMRSGFVHDLLEDEAEEVALLAAELAPDDPSTTAPDLPSSIGAEVVMTDTGWVGRVVAADFKSAWYEEGASGVAARPFLRPALERLVGPVEAIPGDGGEGSTDA